MNILIKLKNIFKNNKIYTIGKQSEQSHFACVAKKDKSGRIRYYFYINGKRVKKELTIEGWFNANLL